MAPHKYMECFTPSQTKAIQLYMARNRIKVMDLAKKLSMDSGNLSNFINGNKPINYLVAENIFHALDESEELTFLKHYESIGDPNWRVEVGLREVKGYVDSHFCDKLNDLVETYSSLEDSKKMNFIDFIDYLTQGPKLRTLELLSELLSVSSELGKNERNKLDESLTHILNHYSGKVDESCK